MSTQTPTALDRPRRPARPLGAAVRRDLAVLPARPAGRRPGPQRGHGARLGRARWPRWRSRGLHGASFAVRCGAPAAPCRAPIEPAAGALAVARLADRAGAWSMCLRRAGGRPPRLVYIAVAGVMCLPTRWALGWSALAGRSTALAAPAGAGLGTATGILPSRSARRPSRCGASHQLMQPQRRAARGPRGERPARGGRRAQPVRPRPARHPRPLADRDHRQGRAGQPAARRRPGPRPGRARRPRAARAATRWPTYAGRWRATATSPCPASSPGPATALLGRRDRRRPAELAPTRCPPSCASCSRGRSARASPT